MRVTYTLATVILLSTVGIADWALMERWPFIDLLWLAPITFAAVFLSPLATVVTGFAASLICLTTGSETVNLQTSALVWVAGVVAALAALLIKRHYHRVNIVRYALEQSPLAYAEFTFPGYSIVNQNAAFARLACEASGAGNATSLREAFPEDSASLISRYMDEAITNRAQSGCDEFHIPTADGRNTFWSIGFIPVSPGGKGMPKTVAFFAFEVTDAVTRARTREAAIRISAQAMSSLNVDETIRVAMDGLAYIAGTNAGALFMLEEDQWVGKAAYGQYKEESVIRLRYPYESLESAAAAVESKEVVAAEDVATDSLFEGQLTQKLDMKSTVIVPLVTGYRVVGVAYLAQSDEKRHFTDEQIKFATILGSHVALAIENALIYQNEHIMRKSLEAIEVVSEAGLVSLDLEEVLIELVTRTQDVMQMDAATILLYDEADKCLVGRASTSKTSSVIPAVQTRLEVGQGIAGRAFKEGVPMKIDNIKGHMEELCPPDAPASGDYPFSEQSGIVSVLAVPLRVAGKIIGILQIGSQREGAFSAREWGLIQVLADRASLAVQNSMLHEETKHELARAALLKDVAAACASTNDIQVIAQRSLQAIYEQLNCQIASVYYLDKESDSLVNLAFMGHPDDIAEDYRVSRLDRGTLLTRACLEKRPITNAEINIDNASETEAVILRRLDIGYNRRANMPIIYGDEVVGAIALVFPDCRTFTPAGLDTLKSITNQLAVAFKNASLPADDPVLETIDD